MRPLAVHNGHPDLVAETSLLQPLFNALDRWPAFQVPPGELSVALLTDEALAEVHRAFLDDPEYTDVITFPGSTGDETGTALAGEEHPEAGEICISVDMARKAAGEHETNPSHELTLYLVHGWLHLAGLDDQSDESRARMREAETAAFAWLEKEQALPVFPL